MVNENLRSLRGKIISMFPANIITFQCYLLEVIFRIEKQNTLFKNTTRAFPRTVSRNMYVHNVNHSG